MLRGLLAAFLILVSSIVWYLNTQYPVEDRLTFSSGAAEQFILNTDQMILKRNSDPQSPTPLAASCGDNVCDEAGGENDWTSLACCATDCNTTCLERQCVTPRRFTKTVMSVPFSHEQGYTCAFPENYNINQWRLQLDFPNKQEAFYTPWQSENTVTTTFFSLGEYTVTCQGRNYFSSTQQKSEQEDPVVINGCSTTASFYLSGQEEQQEEIGVRDQSTGTVEQDDSYTEDPPSDGSIDATTGTSASADSQEVRVCGDNSALVSMNYLRERVLGDVVDETCKGTFYYSNELEGVAGICCPEGKICDLNCDLQISAVDIVLNEQIRKEEVTVELPGDGIDNTCDGQVDCGENPTPYCEIRSCEGPPSATSAGTTTGTDIVSGSKTIIYSNVETDESYNEILDHMITTHKNRIYIALVQYNGITETQRIEVFSRQSTGDVDWRSLGMAQPEVAAEINLRSIESEDDGTIYVSYDLGSSATFTLKRYTGDDWKDITPSF